MSSSKNAAAGAGAVAVGGTAARACDSCLRRHARWYCAGDDAFLCQGQGCDASVHSTNPLAMRHERMHPRPTMSPPDPHSTLEARPGVAETRKHMINLDFYIPPDERFSSTKLAEVLTLAVQAVKHFVLQESKALFHGNINSFRSFEQLKGDFVIPQVIEREPLSSPHLLCALLCSASL